MERERLHERKRGRDVYIEIIVDRERENERGDNQRERIRRNKGDG